MTDETLHEHSAYVAMTFSDTGIRYRATCGGWWSDTAYTDPKLAEAEADAHTESEHGTKFISTWPADAGPQV